MALTFFADHCIPRSVVRAFEAKGFQVAILGDHVATNAPDEVVIAKAQELSCVLITMDGDFADLVRFPPENFGGIIALQVKNHPEVIPQILNRAFAFLADSVVVANWRIAGVGSFVTVLPRTGICTRLTI